MVTFPNTGTQLDQGQTNSGLSTQIIIKVGTVAVGALQSFEVRQTRGIARIKEIGTDGVIEAVPNAATEYEITANRMVFDQLRLPEAFTRGFRFIHSQRVPFDIEIYDISSVNPPAGEPSRSNGLVVMTYKNCWFSQYSTPYNSDNYLITESATIVAETGFVNETGAPQLASVGGIRGYTPQTDAQAIESSSNAGSRRGALDASGLINSLFT
jgi:hypothetical protein